jgi:serine/threonine protein kinase
MEYLHFKKIIHRDLKLDNILLTKDLKPKITDFGISKVLNENSNTKTKKIGTSIYMAPEVILTNNYDQKCDVFSFSIIMYQLLTEKLTNVYKFTEGEIDEISDKNDLIVNEKYVSNNKDEEMKPLIITNKSEKNSSKNSSINLSEDFFNIELKVANDSNFRPYISKFFLTNSLKFNEFLQLMKNCWSSNPKERFNFF